MNARVEPEAFDAQYAAAPDGDPWEYASSEYEQRKYARTLAALPDRRFPRALEAGCSIGVFTRLLAPRCDVLIAVDFSDIALAEARARTADLEGVEVCKRALPEGMPAGPFDLVVCSDILYYWSAALVTAGLEMVEQALAPGGSLLVVNWDGNDPEAPLDGKAVHELIRERTVLTPAHAETHDGYLIERWDAAVS